MQLIFDWLIYSLAIIVSAYILPGVKVDSFAVSLITALILGILNAFIKPLLVLLTLPINILTLGLFSLVINAILILITSQLVPGFRVDGFWWALLFSIILSIISSILFSISVT